MATAAKPAAAWHPMDATRRRTWCLVFLAGAGIGGGWYWTIESAAVESAGKAPPIEPLSSSPHEPPLQLEVVRPHAGGLPRLMVQTGSVEAYASADLFAKVSGYLKSIAVELGDRVSEGQLVAEIDAPELAKDIESAAARLERSRVQVLQARARLQSAQAQQSAAKAAVTRAEAEIRRAAAQRSLNEKEFARIEQLAADGAVQSKLVDEAQQRLEAARAAEDEARAAADVTRADLQAAVARTAQARADVAVAEADVRVATAALEQSQVMADYTRLRSPHTGVVTRRSCDPGDFVRSALAGGAEPLLSVARIDRMRVVVQIPDGDSPFVRPGNPAEVRIDALGGETFAGTISRISHSQDRQTRTMRAEIDLPNPDGRLQDGMYGAVQIRVPASPEPMTLPSSCLAADSLNGKSAVFVVRNGRTRRLSVRTGRNNGGRVELLSGLEPADLVVLDPDDSLRDDVFAEAIPCAPEDKSVPDGYLTAR